MADPSWYEISNGISGILFIVLGVLVGRVRSHSASNRAFALFAIAFGAGISVLNLVLPGHPIDPVTTADHVATGIDAVLWLAAAAGLLWLAVATRQGRGVEARVWTVVAPLVAVVYLGLGLVVARVQPPPDLLFFVTFQSLLGVMWGLCVLFAYRFTVATDAEATGYATMSAALALYPAFWGAIQFGIGAWLSPGRDGTVPSVLFFVVPALGVAAVWMGTFARVSPERVRMARRVVWSCLAAALAGSLAAPSSDGSEHWGYGAARFLAVGLLAFAIVRGQAPGIDGRLRFGVSRSTLAAVFVTMFFVVSEGAQLVLGRESQVFGLVAAAALVFVLTPLQRAAERLAEVAVPRTQGEPTAASTADPESVFRQALRIAVRDGRLSPEEELRCAELADSLGIRAGRAIAIMRDVMHESVPRG